MWDWIAGWWSDVFGRFGGPMTFRIILQPTMAALLAFRGGLRDAKLGRPPYFWSILTDSPNRADLIREGWKVIARVFILAIVMDLIYQLIVLKWVYPLQLLLIAILLAVVPYILIRGPVNRIARRFQPKPLTPQQTTDK